MQFVCAVLNWWKTSEPKQENHEIGQYFTFEESKLGFGKQFLDKVLYEVMFVIFWRKFSREAIFNFLSRKLSGETLCKLLQIFPPKVLVYIWTNFSWHFFDYLMEIHQLIRRQNTCIFVYSLKYVRTKIKITKWNSKQHCWFYWLVFNNNMVKYARNLTILQKRKKTAHAYFGRLYFF